MKELNKQGDNMGGLIKIWAVPNTDFSVSGTTVNFSSTDNIYEIYCSPDSMQFTEVKEITNAGIHYKTALSGFAPKDSVELQEALEYIEPRKWVVIFIDGNGRYKLAGTGAQPLQLAANLISGKNTADRAGCEIPFSGRTLSRAVFIDNPF
jgi:hypothetical protein